MTVIQSLLIALFCVISGNEFPLYGSQFGWYVLGRPLIGGLVCGLILGDVTTGVTLRVAVQLVYLAVVTPGGSLPIELSFVSYPVMGIAIANQMNSGAAIALAATIGVLGTFVFQLNATIGAFFHKGQDAAIEDADYKKYNRHFWIYPQLVKLITRGIPSFIALYFGAGYVDAFMSILPGFVENALLSLGGILPAVGIATLLVQSVRENSFILFFVVGFVGIVFMNLNIIGLTAFGGALAFLYYKASVNGSDGQNGGQSADDFDEEAL